MTTATFWIKYRPVKISFLIEAGCIADIIKASEINTLLCRGIYNPLIPVSEDNEFSKQLINLY